MPQTKLTIDVPDFASARAASESIELSEAGEPLTVTFFEIAGTPTVMTSPAAARKSGIAVVHQELSLFPLLNVVSNVYAGSERHAALGWMQERQMRAELAETMASLGWSIPADMPVGRLPLAEQQMVEIVRAFHFHADLVLLDEPNSSFTDAESKAFYDAVRRFRTKGQAFLLVSHRLDEVMEIADEVTILRDGRVVHSGPAAALTVADAVRHMVGDKGTPRTVDRPNTEKGPVRVGAVAVASGRLRSDLYYRLAGVTVTVPPLRARVDDILPLAAHLLARAATQGLPDRTLGDDAASLLRVHALKMHRRRLVFVINGFGIERVADAGERLANLGLLFG